MESDLMKGKIVVLLGWVSPRGMPRKENGEVFPEVLENVADMIMTLFSSYMPDNASDEMYESLGLKKIINGG